MGSDTAIDEPRWGEGRELSLGWPEPLGSAAIDQRLALLDELHTFHGEGILDVGCGNGAYTERLAEHFTSVVGVEVEAERLDEFRDRVAMRDDAERFDLRLQSAEALSDPDGTYDAVIAIETLEHVVNAKVAASEVFRVLRPGGHFYITVPNRGFPFETHSFMIGGRERRAKWYPFVPWVKPLHRRISTARNYRPQDLRALLGGAGFREVGTTFMMPPLERWGPGRYVRRPVKALERTPLRHLGVSVVTVWAKPEEPAVDPRGQVSTSTGQRQARRGPAVAEGARRPTRPAVT